MSGHGLAVPGSPAVRALASIGWFGVMVVAWLSMVLFAVVMLIVMVMSDMMAQLRGALHLGPAPTAKRASYRIASLF